MRQPGKDLVLVTAATCLFRLPFLVLLTKAGVPEGWDASAYFNRALGFKKIAVALFNGDLPQREMLAQAYTGVWPPMQSAILSLFMIPTDQDLLFGRVGMMILSCLTAGLVYLVTARLADRRAALAAAAVFAILPLFQHYGLRLFSETTFVFFNFLTWYLLLLLIADENRSRAPWLAILLGVALGLNILTRAIGVVWIPMVLLTVLYSFRGSGKAFAMPALVAVAFVLTIMPWQMAMYAHEKRFTFITAWNTNNLYYGNLPRDFGDEELRESLQEDGDYGDLSLFDEYANRYSQERNISVDKAYRELAIRQITGNPGYFLTNGLKKLRNLWSFDVQLYKYLMTMGIPPLPNSVALAIIGASVITYLLYLLLAIFGLALGSTTTRYPWFVAGVMTMAMGIHFLTMAHPRLSYPLAAMLLPYVGYALVNLKMFPRLPALRLGLISAAAVLTIGIVYDGIPERLNKIRISSHYGALGPTFNALFNANVRMSDRVLIQNNGYASEDLIVRVGGKTSELKKNTNVALVINHYTTTDHLLIEVKRKSGNGFERITLDENAWFKWKHMDNTGITYMWSGGMQFPVDSMRIFGILEKEISFEKTKIDLE
jgi:hypothetical protein